MVKHVHTLFFSLPVCGYLPVTEQNVRTVHLESARQMERSLCWNSNLLTAWEFRRLAQNAWREPNRSPKNLHITTKVFTMKCIYVEEESVVKGLKTAESIFVFFFPNPWLPDTEGSQEQRCKGVTCCGWTLNLACWCFLVTLSLPKREIPLQNVAKKICLMKFTADFELGHKSWILCRSYRDCFQCQKEAACVKICRSYCIK